MKTLAQTQKFKIGFVILASAFAYFFVRIGDLFNLERPDEFYGRNFAYIFLPSLVIYYSIKNQISKKTIIILAATVLACVLYTNLIPIDFIEDSQSGILSAMHTPLLIWIALGIAFTGKNIKSAKNRMDYLRYNGHIFLIYGLIAIAGMILTGMTIMLFQFIGLNIEEAYLQWVIIPGMVATPIIANYLIEEQPQIVSKVMSIIAKIFAPLTLLTLVIFSVGLIISKQNPLYNRDLLFVLTGIQVTVFALITFAISRKEETQNKFNNIVLFSLSTLTSILNIVALTALIFRLTKYGFTPNRIVVLGANLLLFINLILISISLFKLIQNKKEITGTEQAITKMLPIYAGWTLFVVFILPVIFKFQ